MNFPTGLQEGGGASAQAGLQVVTGPASISSKGSITTVRTGGLGWWGQLSICGSEAAFKCERGEEHLEQEGGEGPGWGQGDPAMNIKAVTHATRNRKDSQLHEECAPRRRHGVSDLNA